MPTLYHGWIPTVSGALSFSAFGETSHPPRPISSNRSDRSDRYLICYRSKDCSDILLPFRSVVAPWFLNLSGKLWFLCLARARTVNGLQDQIEGHVFIFEDREIWRSQVEEPVRTAQRLLRSYRYGTHSSLEDFFQPSFAELVGLVSGLSAFNAEFTIARSGITKIVVPEGMVVHPNAPRMPDDKVRSRHIEHILAAQLFFFLRDIGHRHQHHDPHTDTIVDLWPEGADSFEWKLQTLFSLYRKIVSYKRVKDPESYAASTGVVAYANTFRSIVERDATEAELSKLPTFYSTNVLASINAVTAEMQRKQDITQNGHAITREVTLAALTLVVAVVGVFQITEAKVKAEPSQSLSFLGDMLVTQPIATLFTVAAVTTIFRSGVQQRSANRCVRWLLRLSQPFDLRITIAAFMLLGLGVLGSLIWILTLG